MADRLVDLDVAPLTDDHADAVIRLVGAAYAEYPGCVLDLPGVDRDLPRPGSHLAGLGGRGWVVLDGGVVVACVGLVPVTVDGRPAVSLERLYVAASHRRRGLGRGLVGLVEDHARRDHGAAAVELWSDTRFTDAHRLYERCGYVRQPGTRDLHDPSNTTEYHFVRWLDTTR